MARVGPPVRVARLDERLDHLVGGAVAGDVHADLVAEVVADPHHLVQVGDALVVGVGLHGERPGAAADVVVVHPRRLVGRDAVGEDLHADDREVARVVRRHVAQHVEVRAELVERRRHAGGEAQHVDAQREVARLHEPPVHVEARGAHRADRVGGADRRVGDAGDAEPGELGSDEPGCELALLVAHRRHPLERFAQPDLVQHAGGAAAGIGHDRLVVCVIGVGIDPEQVEHDRVDPGGVVREVDQHHRVGGGDCVEVVARRHAVGVGGALGEVAEVPALPDDPVARLAIADRVAHRCDAVGDRGDRRERDVEVERRRHVAEADRVDVRVVDAGEQRAAVEVDDAGVRAGERLDVGARADGADRVARDGERLGDSCRRRRR